MGAHMTLWSASAPTLEWHPYVSALLERLPFSFSTVLYIYDFIILLLADCRIRMMWTSSCNLFYGFKIFETGTHIVCSVVRLQNAEFEPEFFENIIVCEKPNNDLNKFKGYM